MFLLLLVLSCRLSTFGIWCHHVLHTNTTQCVWYVAFTTGIVMSSLSFRYLVSPSVAHEHDTLCMIDFFYYWYCHFDSLLYVFGITIYCTRTLHIMYDRFRLQLVLSCRVSPISIWYHHILHTNTTHYVWYVSFTTGIIMSSLRLVFGITIYCTGTRHIVYERFPLLLMLSCLLSPLGIWYHHLLHTNTTQCVW
jgi:hypothetical protein